MQETLLCRFQEIDNEARKTQNPGGGDRVSRNEPRTVSFDSSNSTAPRICLANPRPAWSQRRSAVKQRFEKGIILKKGL
jgi:hypothetical protein